MRRPRRHPFDIVVRARLQPLSQAIQSETDMDCTDPNARQPRFAKLTWLARLASLTCLTCLGEGDRQQ
jgi:hypothetical protein